MPIGCKAFSGTPLDCAGFGASGVTSAEVDAGLVAGPANPGGSGFIDVGAAGGFFDGAGAGMFGGIIGTDGGKPAGGVEGGGV